MVEKRLGRSQMNKGLVFLLIFLVAVGIFFIYAKVSFTGYVTNVVNATTGAIVSSHNFNEGPGVSFSNTYLTSSGNVALQSGLTDGTYISRIFDASQPMIWINFVPKYTMHSSSNYSEDSLNNSIAFYVRSCDDSACTGKDFSLFNGNLNVIGQYFQYKAEMQILSGNVSPMISAVNVSYYIPLPLPINIMSPQATTYNNESIDINISSNLGAVIWFYNETGNETYTGEISNRTYSEGQHTLAVWASYSDGNIIYTNSTSVSFVVGFLHTYYRFSSNACAQISLTQAQKTSNDYNTLSDCQSHITTADTTTNNNDQSTTQNCAPIWDCGNWSDCVDGTQTRMCSDTSICTIVSTVGKPSESQSCTGGITTAPEPETASTPTTAPATTQNTVTTTAAPKKGFFSIVGSVITAPVKTVTGTIVSVLVLLLVAGGFIAFKISKKKTLGAFFNTVIKGIKGIKRERFE